ncbi:hypothetical protein BDV12DRAFT_206716 [Aspergillus spectabilis]
MSDFPTLLFIPGSWHKPSCYDKITNVLESQYNFQCISVTLPSTTGNPAATFKDDLDIARDAISTETSQGRNVVVIAHSYGGMVGNSAIKGFTAPDVSITTAETQSSTTAPGHVIGLILIASGFTMTGLSFMDPFFGHPPPFWRVNSETGFAELVTSPRELFYHDLPEPEAEFWTSQLTTQSLKALFEGGEHAYAGWLDVPVWYIGTVEDRGLPVLVQRMQVGMAREMGYSVEHRELQSSHSPFLSLPEETVRIVDAIGAVMGKSAGSGLGISGDGLMLPKSDFWRPSTWFRFGVPLVVGHVVGRFVLLFLGARRLWRSRSA